MIIDKVNKNTIQKFNNVRTDTILDSNKVSQFFYLTEISKNMSLFITKFNLKDSNPVVYIGGKKCPDWRTDPYPQYRIDYNNNAVVLLQEQDLGTKVEVWGSIEIPFNEDKGIVLTHEVFCTKQTFEFELPWEYDSLNKSISAFVNGKLVSPSEIVCLDNQNVKLMTPVEADSTVVFMSRQALLPANLYGSYFASQPVGSVCIMSGNQIPEGYLPLDGGTYKRHEYPGFVQWLIEDGNYVDSPAMVTNFEYILTPSTFTVPSVSSPLGKYAVKVANAYADTLNNIYIPGNDTPIKKGKGKTVLSDYVEEIASDMLENLTEVGNKTLDRITEKENNVNGKIISEGEKQIEIIENAKKKSLSDINALTDKAELYLTDKIGEVADDNFTRLNQLLDTNKTDISLLVQKAELLCSRTENTVEYKLGAAKETTWELVEDKYPDSILELPVSYVVGTNSLILSYGGFLLYRDVSYQERGVKNSLSSHVILNMKLPKGAVLNAWVCPAMNEDYYKILDNLKTAENLAERLEAVSEDIVTEGEEKLKEVSEAGEKYTEEIKDLYDQFSVNSKKELDESLERAKQEVEKNLTEETGKLTQFGENIRKEIDDKGDEFQKELDKNLERSEEILADIEVNSAIYQGKNLEATMILENSVAVDEILELPIYYIVGCNTLRMSYDSNILYKNIDYEEVGEKDNNSWKVKLKTGLEAGHRLNMWSVVTATMSGVIQEVEKYKDCVINMAKSVEEIEAGEDGFYLIVN